MRDVSRVRFSGLACAALMVALLALGGCGGSGQQAASSSSSSSSSESMSVSEATVSSSSSAASSDLAIGDESAAEASIELTNDTGAIIDAFFVVPVGSDADYQTLLAEATDQPAGGWLDGDTATVYCDEAAAGYDACFGIGDVVYTLHDLPVDSAEDVTIRLEGDVAYLTYEQSGSAVSTLQDEVAIADEAAAAAAEAEAAAAETEVVEDTYYEEPVATSQPTQSQDSCVDGGVVLR